MLSVESVIELYEKHGDSQYGGESVTQLEHALQAALMGEKEGAPAELIAAALLHDIGHLLHALPDDAPESGIDDHHEKSAANYLGKLFPDRVTEPIRLHVAAKRYLCTIDPRYESTLSEPSIVSLRLQGGRMNREEVAEYERHPYASDAVRLRRWDDAAKVRDYPTPPLEHFAKYVRQVARADAREI